ncbi:MAG: hypothetical protein AAFV62_13085, partial [Pseudomonadota bacterium]
ANNAAWDLVEAAEVDAGAMLTAAYAAAYHWRAVGTPVQIARAETLLAAVHARLDRGAEAEAYLRRAAPPLEAAGLPAWEAALIHTIRAMALQSTDKAAAKIAQAEARAMIDGVPEAGERKILERLFVRLG